MKKLFEKNIIFICLIFLASLLIIHPLLNSGFYHFHDESQIANLYQMARAILSGQIPPRWAPDFSFGYGYPFFNFYYPFPFYLGSFFYLVFGATLINSLKVVFLISVPLSGISFFLLMRKFFNRTTSLAGAIIYLFTPYRAVDLYVRGAVGELWSFVFMPLVLLCFINLAEKRSLKSLSFAGLSLAGLLLSHSLSAIIFLPFAFLFALIFALRQKQKLSSLISLALGGLFGFSLSAYFWLPAILERKFVQPGTPFNPFDHFPFIKQLFYSKWGYGASVWGSEDGMSFQIGLVNLAILATAVLAFIAKRKAWNGAKKALFLFTSLSFLACLFLMNIRSGFLWNLLPLGQYVQFPWRFLLLTTLFSSLAVGFCQDLSKKWERWTRFLPLCFAALAIVLNLGYFKPQEIVQVDDDHFLKIMFANITSRGKSDFLSPQYLNYSEDYLPLTIWTQERPTALPSAAMTINSGRIDYQELTAVHYQASVESKTPAEVSFNQYYFPGWRATVDGKAATLKPGQPHGEIIIPVPAGEHRLEIWFGNTLLRSWANLASALSLVFLVAITLGSFTKTKFFPLK
ncbi:MAG TPA: 6-pyruvoyl-tetrahydropterin synthase-related protein [Clostridia bacterium]|nr:6-pyruvoyl-tetrahydropterin synthase-related protein [Clostridia bacterium]